MFSYQSITTPDLRHKKPYQFAAEVIVYRAAVADGVTLPQYFWRKSADCPDCYKDSYSQYCEMLAKATKIAPDHFVVLVCIYSKLQHLTYPKLVGTLNYRWDKWNEKIAGRFINMVKIQQQQSVGMDTIKQAAASTTSSIQSKRKKPVLW